MNTTIQKVLRWFIIGGIFLLPFVPLVVAQDLFFPFITGKNFLFRLIVEAVGVLWLALAILDPEYRPRRTWLIWAFAAFVIIMAIADALGANPSKSFWSNFERMEGWVTLAHLFVLFAVMSSVFKLERIWRYFWMTSIGVSVLIGFYSILQFVGMITIDQGSTRLDATFGNSTYLAVYMLFHLFITMVLLAQLWREGKRRIAWAIGLGLVMLLQFFSLFFTETRGAILGLFGGAFLTALIFAVLARHSRIVWRVSVGFLVAVVVLAGLFFALKNTPVVQDVGPLHRLASISLSDNTTIARFMNWGMAWEGFKESPKTVLIGWGQEDYNIVFDKYYNPAMYAQEQWFDRVHNIVFDWLIAGGVFGLAAYVSLFAAALWMLWKRDAFSLIERALFTGLLAGYVINNLVVFDNITSYLLFIFVLAYLASRVIREKGTLPILPRVSVPSAATPYVAALGVVVAVAVMYAVNANAYAANRALLNAVSPQASLQTNLDYFNQAIAYNSLGTQEAREQLVQGALGLAGNTAVATDTAQALFAAAAKGMQDQEAISPQDARFPYFLGALYGSYGDTADALTSLKKAVSLSPNKQSIRFQLGLTMLAAGQKDQALALFKDTYELDTDDTDAKIYYAMAAIRDGRNDIADPLVASLESAGLANDDRIVGSYAAVKEYSKIIPLWTSYLALHPGDVQAQLGLAAAYYANGQHAQAIATLKALAASSTDPNVKSEADTLVTQIENGTINLQQ